MKKLTKQIAFILLTILAISFTSCDQCHFPGDEEAYILLFPNDNEIAVTYHTNVNIRPISNCNPSSEFTEYFEHDNRFYRIQTRRAQGEKDIPEKNIFKFDNKTGKEYYVVRVGVIQINGGEHIYLSDLPTKEYSCEQIIDSLKSQYPEKIFTISEKEASIEGVVPGEGVVNIII